jgi:uncharacterized protein
VNMDMKYQKLKEILRDMGSTVIAFSGGVDSTLLIKIAYEVLGNKAIAVTVTSPFHPDWELQESKKLAAAIGIKQVFLSKDLKDERLKKNPVDRCYICKKDIFQKMILYAKKNGYAYVIDGTNDDDLFDYRPGMRALNELKIRSPLWEAKMTKNEIRLLSKKFKLDTWNKPPYACLLTRIPYGREIKVEDLEQIESAETYLLKLGFKQVRVRVQDNIARIELGRQEFHKIFNEILINKINKAFKSIGFQYVTLDLEGYKMGSLNRNIEG